MTDLYDEWRPFIDSFGLVQPDNDGATSDNGVRFTTEAILAGYPNPGKLYEAILRCNGNGLLSRYPGCKRQDSFDNYIAALAASYVMKGDLAKQIHSYGVKHGGFYCNDGFAWNAWLWRNPSLVSFSRFCANGDMGWFDQKCIAQSIYMAADSTEQDSKILSWFMTRCLRKKYSCIDTAIGYWQEKLRQQYPDGIGDVLGRYYWPQGYRHPNAIHLKGVFG